MDISIGDNHKTLLAQAQQHIQWLQSEQTRLEIERQYVARQNQQAQAELVTFLQRTYGIDAQHSAFTLDMERGVIIVPGVPDATTTGQQASE